MLAAAKEAWRADRKPANILLVLDTSGSMQDENRLERAKEGLEVFFREVGQQDSVGLLTFNQRPQPGRRRSRRSARTASELQRTVRNLIADGGTAFYDAAVEGFQSVRDLDDARPHQRRRPAHRRRGHRTRRAPTRRRSSELGTQGDSREPGPPLHDRLLRRRAGAAEQLDALAAATGGKGYEGTTEDIESVYRSISSFF